jgi:hypothetical protein
MLVDTRRVEKATRNADDSVAKCQERTATACDVELGTVQVMHLLQKAFSFTERIVLLQTTHDIDLSLTF